MYYIHNFFCISLLPTPLYWLLYLAVKHPCRAKSYTGKVEKKEYRTCKLPYFLPRPVDSLHSLPEIMHLHNLAGMFHETELSVVD